MTNWRLNLSKVSRLCAPMALVLSCLGGCLQTASDIASKDPPNAYDVIRSTDLQPRFPEATRNANTGGPEPSGASYYGTPVEALVNPAPQPDAGAGEGFSLNFENTPIATVAKVVLGDILNVGYAIDPRAQGTISLSSGRPIAKKDMLFVLENALRVNNLLLIRDVVGYRILPATDGGIGSVDRPGAGGATEPGYGLTVIPVQYVSGETLVKLMEGFEAKPGTIRTDPSGKILLVLGTGTERQAALDTVHNFDVDWLRGQSVGIYPVHNGAPATLVTELEKVMDSGETGLSHNLVKFQAVERQNSILVVASKPELLRMASTWISRLDRSAVASTGVKVYRVKYGDARQMATLLSNMFTSSGSSGLELASNQIAPNAGATTLSTVDRLTGVSKQETPGANAPGAGQPGQGGADAAAAISTAGTLGPLGGGGAGGSAGGAPLPNVRITADVANNSILVYASEEDYRVIERALNQLDRPRLQVAIDVTIAEVTLNDQLNYGVQFFLDKGALMNVSQTTLPITPSLPGFNVVLGNALSPRVVINALHAYTDVKIFFESVSRGRRQPAGDAGSGRPGADHDGQRDRAQREQRCGQHRRL